jgi:hypothetical protein
VDDGELAVEVVGAAVPGAGGEDDGEAGLRVAGDHAAAAVGGGEVARGHAGGGQRDGQEGGTEGPAGERTSARRGTAASILRLRRGAGSPRSDRPAGSARSAPSRGRWTAVVAALAPQGGEDAGREASLSSSGLRRRGRRRRGSPGRGAVRGSRGAARGRGGRPGGRCTRAAASASRSARPLRMPRWWIERTPSSGAAPAWTRRTASASRVDGPGSIAVLLGEAREHVQGPGLGAAQAVLAAAGQDGLGERAGLGGSPASSRAAGQAGAGAQLGAQVAAVVGHARGLLEQGAAAAEVLGAAELGRDLAEVEHDLGEQAGVTGRLVQLEGLAQVAFGAAIEADRGVGDAEVGELDAGGRAVAEVAVDLQRGAEAIDGLLIAGAEADDLAEAVERLGLEPAMPGGSGPAAAWPRSWPWRRRGDRGELDPTDAGVEATALLQTARSRAGSARGRARRGPRPRSRRPRRVISSQPSSPSSARRVGAGLVPDGWQRRGRWRRAAGRAGRRAGSARTRDRSGAGGRARRPRARARRRSASLQDLADVGALGPTAAPDLQDGLAREQGLPAARVARGRSPAARATSSNRPRRCRRRRGRPSRRASPGRSPPRGRRPGRGGRRSGRRRDRGGGRRRELDRGGLAVQRLGGRRGEAGA